MALKDLKSDLSKFRMPKQDPLVDKKVTEVNKKLNKTPLSSLLNSTPEISRPNTNPTKKGVTQRNFDNSSKFLGETDVNKFDNSSNFLGETDTNKLDNSSKFLGETDVNKLDNSSKFLGETNTSDFDNSSNFLGETNPNKFDNSSNFLGETDTSKFDNSSNFLGETNPNKFDNSSNFLGETNPNKFDNSSNFLGETDAGKFDNSSNFLGETNPNKFDFNPNHELNGKNPSEVNYFTDIHASGFTSKFQGKDETKFVGINPDNTLFDNANSRYSNFLNSFPGLSFAAGYERFKPVGDYTGDVQRYNPDRKYYIDNQFINKNISQLQEMRNSPSFLDKMYDKFNLKDDSRNFGTGIFRHPLVLTGIQRKGISNGEPQNYGQFGLGFDDGLVRGGTLSATTRATIDFARINAWVLSPKGLVWGIKQTGLQLSNPNVESIGPKRLTQIFTPSNMLATILGQNIGFRSQRHGIFPSPILLESYEEVQKQKKVTHIDDISLSSPSLPTSNRLLGLWSDSFIVGRGTNGGSTNSKLPIGAPFPTLQSPGGINTLYGIIPNGNFPKRGVNTIPNIFEGFNTIYQYASFQSNKTETSTRNLDTNSDSISGASEEGFETFRNNTPLGKNTSENDYKTYNPDNKDDTYAEDKGNNIIGTQYDDETTYESSYNPNDLDEFDSNGSNIVTSYKKLIDDTNKNVNLNDDETHKSYDNPFTKEINSDVGSHKIEKLDNGIDIKKYETISYGNLPEREAGSTGFNDFRSLLSSDNVNNKIAKEDNYSQFNVNTRTWFQDPGKIGQDRSKWWYTSKNSAENNNNERYDRINALDVGESTGGPNENNDLVHLWFQVQGGSRIQFRGTANSISETFSPSWDSIKYNGRADQAYKYSSFERSVSFGFRVVATSRIEMKPIWNKLQRLSTYTMPTYDNSGLGYKGNLVRFRLGSLWNNKLAFIESLSYTMIDDMSWEISILGSKEPLGELPKGIDISIGLKILDDNVPELNQKVYDFNF